MWHLKSSPIFVNTVRKIKALKIHGMCSRCYHIISSNVRSFKKFVHNNFLVLFERLKTWTLVRLLSQCTYQWFYFMFTCIGIVNFHCPLNECLSNINKYITVFTSILIYSDTDTKLNHEKEDKDLPTGWVHEVWDKSNGWVLVPGGSQGKS